MLEPGNLRFHREIFIDKSDLGVILQIFENVVVRTIAYNPYIL